MSPDAWGAEQEGPPHRAPDTGLLVLRGSCGRTGGPQALGYTVILTLINSHQTPA